MNGPMVRDNNDTSAATKAKYLGRNVSTCYIVSKGTVRQTYARGFWGKNNKHPNGPRLALSKTSKSDNGFFFCEYQIHFSWLMHSEIGSNMEVCATVAR